MTFKAFKKFVREYLTICVETQFEDEWPSFDEFIGYMYVTYDIEIEDDSVNFELFLFEMANFTLSC